MSVIQVRHQVDAWMLEYAAISILLDHLLEEQLKPGGGHLGLEDCFDQGLRRVNRKSARDVLLNRLRDYGTWGVEGWHEDTYDAPTEDENPEILNAVREKIATLFPEVE